MFRNKFTRLMKVFYVLGIWQKDGESLHRKICTNIFYMVYNALFQIFLVVHAIKSENINERLFLIAVEILLSVVTIKLFYLLWKQDTILAFLYDPIVTHAAANSKIISEQLNNKLKTFMRFANVYTFMLYFTVVFYMVSSLPFTEEKRLPLFISFNLVGKYSMIIYWIEYVFLVTQLICGFSSTTINVIIWYTLFNYSLEYEVIGHKMRNLNVHDWKCPQPSATKLFEINCIAIFKSIEKLRGTIERFKECFSLLFLAQITTSSITICISAYVLAYSTGDDKLIRVPIFSIALLYGIFEIYLLMYLANEINLSSAKLSYCMFQSNWLGLPMKSVRVLLILCELLKESHQLIIWKIYHLNLDTFVAIINGAYRMFNLLKNFG